MSNTSTTDQRFQRPYFRMLGSQLLLVLGMGLMMLSQATAATPDQAYHRTPVCADGNCVPNRPTNGYHPTRWRPWPGGEPSQEKSIPPVGIELQKIQELPRDKELELPSRPNAAGDAAASEPSPNDKSSGGIVLPPEFRDVTPKKPVEETPPDNSSMPRGPQFPGIRPDSVSQPLLLGKKFEPPRPLTPVPPNSVPATEPSLLKIRPAGNSQSGLMPEMVPWNDEDKNPIIRQAARITGNHVQHTINLDEANLPDAGESKAQHLRIRHEPPPTLSIQTSAISHEPFEATSASESPHGPTARGPEWRSPAVNAPAILPNIEAQPLPALSQVEPSASGASAVFPLRGVSQGNPLRP